jgi:hypothetical protein
VFRSVRRGAAEELPVKKAGSQAEKRGRPPGPGSTQGAREPVPGVFRACSGLFRRRPGRYQNPETCELGAR